MKVLSIVIISVILLLAMLVISWQIRDYFSQDDPMIQKLKRIAQEVAPEAASQIRIYRGDKSYTINKRNVYLCLRDENGEYYNLNILCYVLFHEIGHSISKSIGHTEEFDEIFKKLLKKAEELGYYDPTMKIPQDYCEY